MSKAESNGRGTPSVQTYDYKLFGDVEEHPIDGLHQAMACRLTASWREVPHVTHFDDFDITDLESRRRKRNETQGNTAPRLSLLALIVSAVSEALSKFPDFNASIDPDGQTLYRKAYRNIGIAVDTDAGLLVPVLHNV